MIFCVFRSLCIMPSLYMNSMKLTNYANNILTAFSGMNPLHFLIKSSIVPLGANSKTKYKFFVSLNVDIKLIIFKCRNLKVSRSSFSLSTCSSLFNSQILIMFTCLIATLFPDFFSIAKLTLPKAP